MMQISPATDCEGCGKQIGESAPGVINDHVVCRDGISSKIVTFHKPCHVAMSGQPGNAAADPSLQRIHKISLAPAEFGFTPKEIKT